MARDARDRKLARLHKDRAKAKQFKLAREAIRLAVSALRAGPMKLRLQAANHILRTGWTLALLTLAALAGAAVASAVWHWQAG